MTLRGTRWWMWCFAIAMIPAVQAQGYPTRPVRLIVPFPPGGGADVMGREAAQLLSEQFKQQVIVDNRGGAAGRVGFEVVMNAPPDGYTLLLGGSGAMIVAPAMYPKLPYNMQKNFAPISQIAVSPYALLVHPAVPVQTMKQMVALAKSKPGTLNYASSGQGGPGHLAGELFQFMTQTKLAHVAYRGTGPGVMSVMTGETDLIFSNILPAVTAVQTKRLRAIVVTSLKRSSALPDVPTAEESGLKGFEVVTRYALLAPAGTPDDILNRLNAALVQGLRSPKVIERLEADGSQVASTTPKDLAAIILRDTERWTEVVKKSGIKPE